MSAWGFSLVVYFSLLALLFLLAATKGWDLVRFYRQAKFSGHDPIPFAQWPRIPRITVQLPLFNEPLVAKRLIQQIARLDYPREFLEIQVLDDSTDETQAIAQALVAQLHATGLDIHYLHREARVDFKAGALQAGLRLASGELFTIFDADFLPAPDFLRRTVPHFFSPEKIAMVQARWTHLNAGYSILTRLQAILLDAYFVLEHGLQSRAGKFFQFNGSAGVWTRACLEEIGGWQGDSLTEDLDASFRAYLQGWKLCYLPEVEVPAELPIEIQQLKVQQDRWAQGMVQSAKKWVPTLRDKPLPTVEKGKVALTLVLKAFNPLLLLFILATPISLYYRLHHQLVFTFWIDFWVIAASISTLTLYYGAAQHALYPDWKKRLWQIPLAVTAGFGLCFNTSKALLRAWIGRPQSFQRTFKLGLREDSVAGNISLPRSKKDGYCWVEFLIGLYLTAALVYFAWWGAWPALFGILLFQVGFLYVGTLSLWPTPREKSFAGKRVTQIYSRQDVAISQQL